MAEIIKFNGSQIYNEELISKLSPFYHIIRHTNVFLSLILILITLTKTPKTMAKFRMFLLPYSCSSLLMESMASLYLPTILHPFFFVYPLGFSKNWSPNISLTIIIFFLYSAFAIMDCCCGLVLERFYAIRLKSNSNVPFIIFGILSLSSLTFFILYLIFININYFKYTIFLTPMEIENILNSHLTNIPIDVNWIIACRGGGIFNSNLSWHLLFWFCFGFFRVLLILIILILNALKSKQLLSLMSENLKQSNNMLLLVTYTQFFGFSFILGSPFLLIISLFYLTDEPQSDKILYIWFLVSCFGLYDCLLTILFIKPYRDIFVNSFRLVFSVKKETTVINIASVSAQSVANR